MKFGLNFFQVLSFALQRILVVLVLVEKKMNFRKAQTPYSVSETATVKFMIFGSQFMKKKI